MPPDMSEYSKTTDVKKLIETQITPILEGSHEHENKDILDSITAIDTHLDEMSSNPVANYVLALAIDVLNVAKHNHSNIGTLEKITDDFVTLLSGLQQFEDSTKYDIQTIRESVEPVISQAHWHHNLTILNSITAAKMAEWDKVSDIETDLQQFRDYVQYDQQNQNDAILNLENRITILESQIASGNNAVTLFSAGSDVFEKYDNSLVFMVNNGTYPFMRFVEQYPDFCSESTDFALNYSSAVFNWGVTIQSAFCNPVSISPNSKVLLEYLAGANSDSELYFVSPDGIPEGTPIADFVFEKIKNNDCRKVSFEWLYSANYITTLISCSDIPTGDYYIAWTGVSDNTHPLVKRIQVLS